MVPATGSSEQGAERCVVHSCVCDRREGGLEAKLLATAAAAAAWSHNRIGLQSMHCDRTCSAKRSAECPAACSVREAKQRARICLDASAARQREPARSAAARATPSCSARQLASCACRAASSSARTMSLHVSRREGMHTRASRRIIIISSSSSWMCCSGYLSLNHI